MIRNILKNAAICLLVVVASAAYAQSSSAVDQRITEVYGDYIQHLSQQQLQNLVTDLQRTEVQQVPVSQGESYPLLSSLRVINKYRPELQKEAVFDPQHINPLKYAVDFTAHKDIMYRIDGTDYVLLVRKKD